MALHWFRHDFKAKSDSKLIQLECEFGQHEGYSMWFRLLEIMGETGGYLDTNNAKGNARLMATDMKTYQSFIAHCISLDLLIDDGDGRLVNDRFSHEIKWHNEKSRKNSDSAKARWNSERNADAVQTQCERIEPEPDVKITLPKVKRALPPYQEIVEFWNARAIIGKCAKITDDVRKAIDKRAKEHSLDEIKTTIDTYHKVVNSTETYWSKAWGIIPFFKQVNGFPNFCGDPNAVMLSYKKSSENAQGRTKSSEPSVDPIAQEKRRQEQIKAAQDEKLKNAEIIKTVNAKKWHEFDTFYEFMRWTSKLPDQDAVNGYEMPDRVRQMRSAPSISMISILAGKPCPQWAEDEFAEIKKEMK
jgi:uncharacterized protein YdaU (DUF1376 family)